MANTATRRINQWWGILIPAGLLCAACAYYLFIYTNIRESLIAALYCTGTVLFFVIKKWWKKAGPQWIIRILLAFVCGGAPLTALVLGINKSFAAGAVHTGRFSVEAHGYQPGGSGNHTPYLVIDFYGNRKELPFYREDDSLAVAAKSVTIEYRKGLLGFEIISRRFL
ncbi:MAG: hypothetical protein EOO09_11765 [Chitinophagaceae bacterium]|nr:MAG: hypothetical protein EOO09_11765 [Chitinophagaceae bacterium]